MKSMVAILRRDYAAFFKSPIGYVVIAIYMLLNGIIFSLSMLSSYADYGSQMISFEWIFFLILLPMITMRSFSEDRKNGTEILLLTSPSSVWQIVLGKFFAIYSVFLTMTAGSLVFPLLTLAFGGNVDIKVLGAFIGFIGLGGAFLAIGLFASALTENQVIAAVISFSTVFVLILTDAVSQLAGSLVSNLLSVFSNAFGLTDLQLSGISQAVTDAIKWPNPMSRLTNFEKGIFELSPIFYFISVIAVFLFLTARVIEKRRWSQG